jgi:PLP dependent protein
LLDFELAGTTLAVQFGMSSIAENLNRVREQIATSAAKSGRSADEVELVAITKMHPAEKVRDAIEAGQTLFGESRVQEARVKIPELPSNIRWHFVGHLQKNKIRQALPLFEMIHSIDSLALAEDINRIAGEEGLHPRGLLEINMAGEGSKFGFGPNKLHEQMEALLPLRRLSIEGLMCIPPIAEEEEASRKYFAQLRDLRDSLQNEFHAALPQLSMGMTSDFVVAVEEGATLVRVGTAIFGERSKRQKATSEWSERDEPHRTQTRDG